MGVSILDIVVKIMMIEFIFMEVKVPIQTKRIYIHWRLEAVAWSLELVGH